MDRCMLDVASGGALVNKTPTPVRELIEVMAANSQYSYQPPPAFQRLVPEFQNIPILNSSQQSQQMQAQGFIQPSSETISLDIDALKGMDCGVRDSQVYDLATLQDSDISMCYGSKFVDDVDVIVDKSADIIIDDIVPPACGIIDVVHDISDVADTVTYIEVDDVIKETASAKLLCSDVQLPDKPDQNCFEDIKMISIGVMDSWRAPDWTLLLQPKHLIFLLMKALTENAIIQPQGWTLFLNRLKPPEKTYEKAVMLEGAAQYYHDHIMKALTLIQSIPLPAWMLLLNLLQPPGRDFSRSTPLPE